MQLNYNLNYFRKDSTFSNTYQFFKLDYIFNNKIKSGIEYDFRKSNLTKETINQEDYESKFIGISLENQKLIRTQTGNQFSHLFTSKLKLGNRIAENISSRQLIIEASVLKNLYINPKNHIHTRFKINHLESENYLDNELFRTGGVNSIRGFEENSIFANSFFLANIEYHYAINNQLDVYSLTDIMHVVNKVQNKEENLYALGVGIQIKK